MAGDQAAPDKAMDPAEERKPAAHPVDLAHLSRYTLGNQALEQEVLELFCTQSVVYLDQLRAAMSDKPWKDIAHSLKGSASAVGAWRVAQAAKRAEELQGDGLMQFRAARIDEIEASLREAEAYIVSVLKDR